MASAALETPNVPIPRQFAVTGGTVREEPVSEYRGLVGLQDQALQRAARVTRPGDSVSDGGAALQAMFAELLGSGGRVQNGLSVMQQVRSLTGWVFVAVNRRANAVARATHRIYRYDRAGERYEVTDRADPYAKLMRDINPHETRNEFWRLTSIYLDLTGNALWLKVRDNRGKVRELWTVPTQWIQPWHTEEELLAGYLMTAPGGSVVIPRSEIVHHRNPNPNDRFWGLSVLGAAAEAMKSSNAMKAAQVKAFDNDILSSKFFYTEQSLDEPAWRRMMSNLIDRFSGVEKSGKPVLLYGGTKPVPSSGTPAEMGFRDSMAITRDEILGIFGVPPLLAGVVENANNSNTASQERVFARETTHPILVQLAERSNKSLSPEFGEDYEAEFDDPSPADRLLDNTITNRSYNSGLLTRNEAREEMGYEPVDGGDVFVDEYPEDEEPQTPPQLPAPGAPAGNAETGDEAANKNPLETLSAARPSSGGDSGRRSAASIQKRALMVRTIRKDQDRLTRKTIPGLRKFFKRQRARIVAAVKRIYGDLPQTDEERSPVDVQTRHYLVPAPEGESRLYVDGTVALEIGTLERGRLGGIINTPSHCLDGGKWRPYVVRTLPDATLDDFDDWLDAADELAERMMPRLEESLKDGAELQYDQLNLKDALDLSSEPAKEYLRGKKRTYWNDTVNQTTRDLLGEKLAAVLDDRPTVDKLVEAVEEVMAGRIRSSAETIARTEVVSAYNGGGDIVRDEIGITKKEWVATNDDLTRQSHVDADGQVVAQEDEFNVGGDQLRYPGDPDGTAAQIINCRCSAVAVLEDD